MKVQINIPKRIIDLLVRSGVTSEKSQHNVLKTFVEEVLESGSMGLGGTFDLWWEELPDEEADEIIGFQGS